MIEEHRDITTADGAMNSFVVYPEEDGPFPVVLFYMDAPGKREELHDMARRIAAVGYLVVLPNLYYRRTPDYVLRERTDAGYAEMFGHMHSLDRATTERDTEALLRFVDAHAQADASRIGAVGYCMSGPFVVWAAAAFPERLRCIASIYGANLVTDRPDSPHRCVDRVACYSYFACAEIDKWASPEAISELQARLEAAGTPHRVEWYPGTEHGFAFPKRVGIYHPHAAERHWERLFAQFRHHLGAGAYRGGPARP
ncbi:MAG: dienelactone hydrolase family protein [Pseudomonadota bacterium]|nr:dienelactone hydrolase family protein [Pseudomonadota bacterium]